MSGFRLVLFKDFSPVQETFQADVILFVIENADKPGHVDKDIDKYLRGARERKSLIKRLLGKLAFWKKAGKLLDKLNFLKKKREQSSVESSAIEHEPADAGTGSAANAAAVPGETAADTELVIEVVGSFSLSTSPLSVYLYIAGQSPPMCTQPSPSLSLCRPHRPAPLLCE